MRDWNSEVVDIAGGDVHGHKLRHTDNKLAELGVVLSPEKKRRDTEE